MSHPITDHVANDPAIHQKATTAAAYAASGLNMFFGLTVNEWCMVIGAICALGTFAINWWYRHKENARAERMQQAG